MRIVEWMHRQYWGTGGSPCPSTLWHWSAPFGNVWHPVAMIGNPLGQESRPTWQGLEMVERKDMRRAKVGG